MDSISAETIDQLDGWWRAANYLSVGQIYLLDNPLLRTPLTREDVKPPRLLGHWGHHARLNFLYAHLNRAIKQREQSTVYVTGPGHGGPGLVANAYLDGTYTETYPDITQDTEGLRRLFRQFSFPPGGIPSHVAPPETPGSIHEGGELGYALSHAYGAAFDNPDLLVVAVVGDGGSRNRCAGHQLAFQQVRQHRPRWCGAAGPASQRLQDRQPPTVLARIPDDELRSLMVGFGHEPFFFEVPDDGSTDHTDAHRRFAALLDEVLDRIAEIKAQPGDERPAWPMIVFRTPQGGGPARPTSMVRRPPDRGAHTRFRCPTPATPPSTCRCWPTGWPPIAPKNCSTPTARWTRASPRWHRPVTCG